MKGLHANIYKDANDKFGYDTTNGGMSNFVNGVTVIDSRVGEVFDASAHYPPVKIVMKHHGYVCAVPVVPEDFPLRAWWEKRMWWSMGGNFIYTSDSRLRTICAYPIPLHDRSESRRKFWLAYQFWNYPYHKLQDWVLLSGQTDTSIAAMNRFRTKLFAFYMRRADHCLKTVEDVLCAWRDTVAPREHLISNLVRMEDKTGRVDYLLTVKYRVGKEFREQTVCSATAASAYSLAYSLIADQQRKAQAHV